MLAALIETSSFGQLVMQVSRLVGLAAVALGAKVETGEFRAMMDVELVNDGPVTLWLER